MTNQNHQCVNTIGFIFDTAEVKIKRRKKRVPKSSSTSSLTTTYTTFKDKETMFSTQSTIDSSLTNSLYSSSSNSLYSSNSSSSSSHHNSQKFPCLATSLFTNHSSSSSNCFTNLDCSTNCSSNSSTNCSLNCSTNSSSYFPQKCNQQNNLCNNKLCITPICYEPSICGEVNLFQKKQNNVKCGHKNKKKFKTDIFNKINKYCLIKVTKENFISSTLSVCTENKNECWIKFTENIYELLGGSFLISLSKCNIFRSLYCQLLKINYCPCCEEIKLFFRYNILPPKNIPQDDCLNNINNIDLYYKLKDDIYHNLRFYYDHEYNFNPRYFINL